ncbi:MAG TPA: FtsX-like permease family protein [Stellaceae bacterium]|nr:FtsX-like permease family protein [Stellaceae bacterium]
MSAAVQAWTIARRELRGGLKGFGIFLACLCLGVAVIAGVGSLSAAIDAGLHGDARALLGGDLEFNLAQQPARQDERAFLASQGKVSQVTRLRAMAIAASDTSRSLIELKAIDGAYPLYGDIALDPVQPLAAALAERDGAWGAVVAPALLDKLGLKLGDAMRIGNGRFVLRATLVHEPDSVSGIYELGPRAMVAQEALASTGLIAPGTLVAYAYRLRLPPGIDAQSVAAAAQRQFPEAGWRIRSFGDAAPNLQELLDRVTVFLTLVGLTTLLVGGVGIANSVESYLASKIDTIATLKCLGASRRLVFLVYLLQILTLAAGGIVAGLVLGALVPFAAVPLLPAELPVEAHAALYPLPLLLSAAYGVLATLCFAAWPIGAACETRAASLFRNAAAPERARPALLPAATAGAAALGLLALAYGTAPDRTVAQWFILGAAAALLVFRLAAQAVMSLAALAGRPRQPGLRLALANLHRPGAATVGIVASLGLGLAVLIAVTLVHGDLATELSESLPQRAPSFFFIDIQQREIAPFDRLLAAQPGVSDVHQVPSLRGRITALNGVPIEKAYVGPDARWATSSERGLTYAATLPPGSQLVAGKWWPVDYHGPPLVSFAADLARGMKLKVGDTITINVLGRDITATIANLRAIDWTSLNINFAIVLSPGTLDAAPQSYIATARTTAGSEGALERAVTDAFPDVSAIDVRDALATLGDIVGAIAAAVRITAAITLAAGALVLAGAIAASRRRRVYEAVVLKVLGATRAQIGGSFVIEYGLIGLAAALIASVVGTVAAYFLLTRVMHARWDFLAGDVAITGLGATALTLAAGLAGTWRALGAKAAPFLRNE